MHIVYRSHINTYNLIGNGGLLFKLNVDVTHLHRARRSLDSSASIWSRNNIVCQRFDDMMIIIMDNIYNL